MTWFYLCAPYSHPDPEVRKARYEAVCKAAGDLMCEGKTIFSPLSHTHPIQQRMREDKGHDFWMKADYPFLVAADGLIVLMLDGWQESKGVEEEIRVASYLGKPIVYREP
jgi:uncharacterized protein DUF1937